MKMKSIRIRIQTCSLVLAAVAGSQMAAAADHHVAIYFQSGCPEVPQVVHEATVQANGADKVIWHAIDRPSNNPVTTGYTIYFDPFQGGMPLKDNNNDGEITSNPVDPKTPKGVNFKYTVVGDPAACLSQPLDPVIRVQN